MFNYAKKEYKKLRKSLAILSLVLSLLLLFIINKSTIITLQKKIMKNIGIFSTKDFRHRIHEKDFVFRDIESSITSNVVAYEFDHDYKILNEIKFKKDDVILDIGANIGMISIFIAKKNPDIKIYAFEPVNVNFKNFEHNIKANKITSDIKKFHFGLGEKKENILIKIPLNSSGAASIYTDRYIQYENNIITENITIEPIKEILNENNIKKIKLLKIDCEGCEFDVLSSLTKEDFRNIEYFLGEIHCRNNDKNDLKIWNKILKKMQKNMNKSKINFVINHSCL